MPTFTHAGHRLAYTEHGLGPRVCVLMHGLLLLQRMHERLARALAARGNRVITLDLLGHGRSDRPSDMWRYSMPQFAEQVVALLAELVIGHHRDPVHPFSDAGMLAEELPNGRLVEASTILELRASPKRLTGEIADFLDECWKPRRASGGGARARKWAS